MVGVEVQKDTVRQTTVVSLATEIVMLLLML